MTPTQSVVLTDYRNARADHAPITAAGIVRNAYALNIARALAAGDTPTRPQLDRFRVADQWATTVLYRDVAPLGQLRRAS